MRSCEQAAVLVQTNMFDSGDTEREMRASRSIQAPVEIRHAKPARREAIRCWTFWFGGFAMSLLELTRNSRTNLGSRRVILTWAADPSLGYTELYAVRAGHRWHCVISWPDRRVAG